MFAQPLAPEYEKKPVSPLPESYVPPGGVPYYVMDGEDFWVIASRHGYDKAWDLIEYNFKTRDPKEVNWYLRARVGCNVSTPDRKNWKFTSSAYPGIIYVPGTKVISKLTGSLIKTWVGVGALYEEHLAYGWQIGDFVVFNAEALVTKRFVPIRLGLYAKSRGIGVAKAGHGALMAVTGIEADRVMKMHGMRMVETKISFQVGQKESAAQKRITNLLQTAKGHFKSGSWISRADLRSLLMQVGVDMDDRKPQFRIFPEHWTGFNVGITVVESQIRIRS